MDPRLIRYFYMVKDELELLILLLLPPMYGDEGLAPPRLV